MKKKLLKLLILFLALLLPISAFVLLTETRESPYEKTYLAAFGDKYETLYATEGKKIVFVGNSGLPFGLRTDLLEKEFFDYKVVNYGLYATLGTKLMLDTVKGAVGKGDIIVLCPELSEQTFSLYFNGEATLRATDGFSPMLNALPLKNKTDLFYNYYKYAFDKLGYTFGGSYPDPQGIYRADSLNEYGDIGVERENNLMNNGYDINALIYTTDGLLNKEFIDYVNDFTAYAEKKGATVYFGFAPANIAAVRSSAKARGEFEKKLDEALECELLTGIESYFFEKGYFYDTNYHLNSSGALAYTHMLAKALKTKLNRAPVSSIEVPEAPPLASDVTVEIPNDPTTFEAYMGEPNNTYLDYFTYTLEGNTYKITGVKSDYRNMTEVILPSVYEGKNITAIGKDAFLGCTALERIHIGLTYKSMEAEAFRGCSALSGIYLYETDGNRISPPSAGLLDGASRHVKLYIPADGNYAQGYTWSNYDSYFETFTKEKNETE